MESEDENENFCFFGKPLDPYDEDTIPRKRPITVEEQIATDAEGRRRFHGAFTGGFSAGFFNTVGSLEGWNPSEFKSSRAEKSKSFTQKPQDFMDDEDLGEDGIAPQVVRATSDFNNSRKRKKQVFSDGPIPGEPVLHNILTSGNETIGYMLLKSLRLKGRTRQKEEIAEGKMYGCQMPKPDEIIQYNEGSEYEIPEIYKQLLVKPKSNTFGLGYSGLDKSHFSLFPKDKKANFVVTDTSNKKLSIAGQAFGVGAFEEEDDDIYMKEDMSKYDFELVGEREKLEPKRDSRKLILGIFEHSKKNPVLKNNLAYPPPPQIPHSFTGKHKVKRSRFEPIVKEEAPSTSRINPIIRARYLGEESEKEYTASKPLQETSVKKKVLNEKTTSSVSPEQSLSTTSQLNDIDSYLNDRFVSSTKKEDLNNILEAVENVETIHGNEQMREAVRMKMFGPLTRITSDWVPCGLLCKKFNVPEPFVDRPERTRSRTKNIIFEYQKHIEENSLEPGLKKEQAKSAHTQENAVLEENIECAKEAVEVESIVSEELTDIKNEPIGSVESRPKDITDRIDLEKQQDLFKAVFLSSDSESEKEDEIMKEETISVESNEETQKEGFKSMVLSDQLLPKIKPIKEGVLSGINFHKFVKPDSKVIEINKDIKEPGLKQEEDSSYGPKIPAAKVTAQINLNINELSSESDDEWIEKDSDSKKKKKRKKEKKYKKDKHKKHKHEKKKKYKD